MGNLEMGKKEVNCSAQYVLITSNFPSVLILRRKHAGPVLSQFIFSAFYDLKGFPEIYGGIVLKNIFS